MYQSSSQEATGYIDRYGAIAADVRRYSRAIPPETRQPAVDWIVANVARFESTDAALSILPDINADGIASIRERWPTLELVETVLRTTIGAATRRLFDGTISSTYFTTFMLFQVNDLVGSIGGYSRWAPLVFEIACLGDIVSS